MARKKLEIADLKLVERKAEVSILGESPLVLNSMSFKAMRQLILPPPSSGKRPELTLETVYQEFRDSIYKYEDDNHATRIYYPATGFKASMLTAALETPKVPRKCGHMFQVNVDGDRTVEIYGVPWILISAVRVALPKEPWDLRTRAILPMWAAKLTVNWFEPNLNQEAIRRMLIHAGRNVGIGEWRQERGVGDYGRFKVVPSKDLNFRLVLQQGRLKQDVRIAEPEPIYEPQYMTTQQWLYHLGWRGFSDEMRTAYRMTH